LAIKPKISALVLDIDGVITDGSVSIDVQNRETKRYTYRDVDAVYRAHKENLTLALVTGEDSKIVHVIAERLSVKNVITGAKDKQAALEDLSKRLNVPLNEMCYVGDSDRDAPALAIVGMGFAPADGSELAKQAATAILSHKGGDGAVAEVVGILLDATSEQAPEANIPANRKGNYDFGSRLADIVNESISVKQKVAGSLTDQMSVASEWIIETFRAKNKLILFGNGGSAADAQHMAGEFVGRFYIEREAWAAVALTTDTSILTALANDYDFDSVFARQVEAIARTGDLVIGLSTSGNSPNVVRGIEAAKSRGVRTIGMTGQGGGRMREVCDLTLAVPSKVTPRIQESHITMIHAICEVVESTLFEEQGQG